MDAPTSRPDAVDIEDLRRSCDHAWAQIQKLAGSANADPALAVRLATTLAATLVALYKEWPEERWRGFHHFDDAVEIVGAHSRRAGDLVDKAARICQHRLVNAIPILDQLMPNFINHGHVEHLTTFFERRSILLEEAVSKTQACWSEAEADRLRQAAGRSKPLKERIIDAVTGRPSAEQRLLDASDLYRQSVRMTGTRVRAQAIREVLETGLSALDGRDLSVPKASSLRAALSELEKLTGITPEYRAMQARLANCRGRIFRALPDFDREPEPNAPLSLAR